MNAQTKAPDVTRYRPVPPEKRRPLAEPCDVEGVQERLHSAMWVAARCRAGREQRVVHRLEDRGLFAFAPVNEVWRRRNGRDRHKTLFRYPAAPGYVLVAMEGAFPPWFRLASTPEVFGMLSGANGPKGLSPQEVERLACMGSQAADWQRHMESRREWHAEPGDVLAILRGPFAGMRARLAEPLERAAQSGIAKVDVLGLFGGADIAAEVPVAWMEPA